jgi:hypothetical protein
MLGQMSESSKTLVKETDNGSIDPRSIDNGSMENQDPRLLLSATLATHLTDWELNITCTKESRLLLSTLWHPSEI